jgi:methanogenic corrinoid protein MtbC1
MATVFELPAPSLLTKIIPWVYRAYSAHGYSYDYFPVELDAWIEAAKKHVPNDLSEPILEVYGWMLGHHESWIQHAEQVKEEAGENTDDWTQARNGFLDALLNGSHETCMQMVANAIDQKNSPEDVFSKIMTPSMYLIGKYWEAGKISVAEEHIASSIVSRCITQVYSEAGIPLRTKDSPRVLVSASPGEYHQLGALMLSDSFERDGWVASFCGADTPARDFMLLARSFKPDLVALSVTMPYNLIEAQRVIQSLRSDPATKGIAIMVGGQAFLLDEELVKIVGADSSGFGLEESITQACQLVS